MCVYVRVLLRNVTSTSSALAVAGKELVEQHLERHVLGHDVVFAQVVAAGGTGVHLRSERPLETSLRREDGRVHTHTHKIRRRGIFEERRLRIRPLRTHLADVVRTDGGDGLEGQLLAAHAHEDLLHLAQEILDLCTDRNA